MVRIDWQEGSQEKGDGMGWGLNASEWGKRVAPCEMDFGCSQMNANVGGVSASLNMLRMREMERVLTMLPLPGNESACE